MITPAVVSGAAISATPHAASTSGMHADAGAPSSFDHQLHAARQQGAPKNAEPSSRGSDSRAHASTSRKPDKQPAKDSPAADQQAASPTPPSTAATSAAKIADAATDTKAPTEQGETDEPDDQAASAMAGAMLALLGPSVAGVLRPGAVASAAGTALLAGKAVAGEAKDASLLQPDAVSGTVATPVSALAATAGMLVTNDRDASPPVEIGKDASKELAQAVALPAPSAPAAPATTMHVLQLQSAPGSHAFSQDLGQQVAWLGGQDVKQARIRLHPEELGSLDVSVSVTHGRVDVVINAQHPAAVTAVQQSLPQLDHMLAQHGLSLGHAEVGQQHRGDRHGHAGDADNGALEEVGDVHGGVSIALGNVGLLDAFA